jgi:hypothetical protein
MLNINTLRRGAIATAVCAMITGSAQAAIFDYGFTVSGEWFDDNGTPFNTLPSPYLTGTVQVDNSLLGYAAITSFSFWTEDKHWTWHRLLVAGRYSTASAHLLNSTCSFPMRTAKATFTRTIPSGSSNTQRASPTLATSA